MSGTVSMRARARSAIGLAMLLACCACAFALDPKLDVSQYAHTAWKIREGFSKGEISSIAQTPDGYLWLGTVLGLLRFDGVRAVPWQPPDGEHLPDDTVIRLLATSDGTLWIGTTKGLACWKGGKLTQFSELSERSVVALLDDHEGTVWASGVSGIDNGRLCAIRGGSVQCYGADGGLGHGVSPLYEDSRGNLWAGAVNGLWRWKPGPPKFYPIPGRPAPVVSGLLEDEKGTLVIATSFAGIRQLVDGNIRPYSLPGFGWPIKEGRLFRDRDGGLWIGTSDRGLVHLHKGRTDVFGQADGLSGDWALSFFEDREGNVWVATTDGLDRFREFPVSTISKKQGLSNNVVTSVLAARDGSVWLGTFKGLSRWKDGEISTYRKRNGLPDDFVETLFQDSSGRIWASTPHGVVYFENDSFVPVRSLPPGRVNSIAEDAAGDLWIAYGDRRALLHLRKGNVTEQFGLAKLGRKDWASDLLADPVQGGLWLGFSQGGLAYLKDDQLRASYTTNDGLGQGMVTGLQRDPDGTLWAATQGGGLSRVKNGRIATLTSKNGLPCDAISSLIEDDERSLWLYMGCSLARIARPELDAWVADHKRTIQVTSFDMSEGVRSRATWSGRSANVAKTADGKLWFIPFDGVSVIDPRHLPFNKLAPPVHIEQITADRKTYDATSGNGNVRLPPRIRDLQIDYTALSFVAPEKVLFRYKLEGFDQDWQDAGNRRQAFYTNLPPRNYTFRVKACNNSGVWNEAGTYLNFSVAPAYYQSIWFRSVCVIAFLALLAGLYQMRLRRLQRQFAMTIEARVGERMRIARELHDTLLQSFQGVLMKFEAAADMLPAKVADAQKILETTTVQARKAITEGRDAVSGLRASTTVTNELARAIRTLGEELAAVPSENGNCVDFHVFVEGASRDMVPLIRDEIYRLACEAMRNAFKHARATRIEVELSYEPRKFRLRVSDNGKGIEPKVLAEGGVSGHFGLPGMQERARLVKSKLTVHSAPGSGTEIEFSIPAAVAYAKSPGPHASTSSAKEPDVSGSSL